MSTELTGFKDAFMHNFSVLHTFFVLVRTVELKSPESQEPEAPHQ